MGEKRVVVPEGMYDAAMKYQDSGIQCGAALEAALRWLSENPIVPTEEQAQYMYDGKKGLGHAGTIRYCMIEWQRRMFLAPEPNPLDDLYIFPNQFIPVDLKVDISANDVNVRINEAYRRGQQSREK